MVGVAHVHILELMGFRAVVNIIALVILCLVLGLPFLVVEVEVASMTFLEGAYVLATL